MRVLRAFGDQLIALNMTEGSSSFPNRVRFSNVVLANSIPDSWDAADTTKLAGFVDLVEQDTAIVDGLTLGSNFIIYTSTQVWLMDCMRTFLIQFQEAVHRCRGYLSELYRRGRRQALRL